MRRSSIVSSVSQNEKEIDDVRSKFKCDVSNIVTANTNIKTNTTIKVKTNRNVKVKTNRTNNKVTVKPNRNRTNNKNRSKINFSYKISKEKFSNLKN